MSATPHFFEGTVEQYEAAKSDGSLLPKSFYLVDGKPHLALSETTAFAFVDANMVSQMIAGLSAGGGNIRLGTIGGKAPTQMGTPGTSNLAAHEDHTHAAQSDILGNAATADKLKNIVTIRLTGAIAGAAQFDGSGDCIIPTTLQAESSGLSVWAGTASEKPTTEDANTVYMIYEDE
jgi:hypothetical protein